MNRLLRAIKRYFRSYQYGPPNMPYLPTRTEEEVRADQERHDMLVTLARKLKCTPEELPAKVREMQERLEEIGDTGRST